MKKRSNIDRVRAIFRRFGAYQRVEILDLLTADHLKMVDKEMIVAKCLHCGEFVGEKDAVRVGGSPYCPKKDCYGAGFESEFDRIGVMRRSMERTMEHFKSRGLPV